MAKLTLAGVFKSNSFAAQTIAEQFQSNSDLLKSNAVAQSELYKQIAASSSTTADIPFNKKLTGRSQQYTEGTIQVNGLNSGVMKAVAVMKAEAWGATDLATELSGDDKMGAISTRIGSYWADDTEVTLSLMLDGVFSATSMSDHIVDFSYAADEELQDAVADAVIEAQKNLGKAGKKLKTIYCGSGIYAAIQKSNLYTSVRDPADANISVDKFLGKYDIVLSDSLDEFDLYLFGEGTVIFGDGSDGLEYPFETDRSPLDSTSYIINRQKYVLHVNGLSYTGSISGISVSDEELSNGANWTRVYDKENVLAVKVNISQEAAE